MARVNVATQQVTRDGLVAVLAQPDAGEGDVIDSGAVALWVANDSGSPVTVTVTSTATQDGLDLVDLEVVVVAGDQTLIGPFPQRTFGQPAGANESGGNDAGRVYVGYSSDTDVERAVVRL